MAPDNDFSAQSPWQQALARFRALPRNGQLVILGVIGVILLFGLTRCGGTEAPTTASTTNGAASVQVDLASGTALPPPTGGDSFQAVETSEATLRRNFAQEVMAQVTAQQEEIERKFAEKQAQLDTQINALQDLQGRLESSNLALDQQRRDLEESIVRQREELSSLAEEARRQSRQVQAASDMPLAAERQKGPITQIVLSGGGGIGVNPNQALLPGATQGLVGGEGGGQLANNTGNAPNAAPEPEPAPFIPPLGFIKATLLNGVDALVGGRASPALLRLHGKYKTAMNSTVILDGCFMLMEFEGEISTERARGKPVRMTCVYPDRGAVTYSLSGYAVDAEDGVEGVPGVFYEGDAGRVAAALVAEFVAGLSGIVEQNQSTSTVDADGTERRVITGDEGKAEIAGAANRATASLSEYLFARANRILPFIRLDAKRQIHIVLLSGTELRNPEGKGWSMLFDASKTP